MKTIRQIKDSLSWEKSQDSRAELCLDFFGAEDAAELGRIGKYYAVEDMLTTEPSEKFGSITLREHYERIAVEGQEYDPYTTMLAPKKN